MIKKVDYCIINRSFWPEYGAIGEGLLLLAESFASEGKKVIVISATNDLKNKLKTASRGKNIFFKPLKKIDSSNSNLLIRIFSSIIFASWCATILVIYRPKMVYVSTDPPIIVPLIVALFCKIFKAKYVYHYQDIQIFQ